MKIYLDLVIIVNFIFDLILLMSVNYILRRNVSWWRLILGSLVGELTMVILFFDVSSFLMLFFKILISLIMLSVSFGYRDFNYFKKNVIYFYLVSMLMGGGITFLKNQFSYSNDGLVFRQHSLEISYIIVILISFGIYFKYMFSFKNLKNNYSNYYKCHIYFDDNNYIVVNAFLDTGNKLNDPYSDKSIILINEEKIKNLNIKSPIYVPYNSLNNHGLLTCYKANKLVINGKENDKFLVGVSNNNFFMDGIDCIINDRVMEGLR